MNNRQMKISKLETMILEILSKKKVRNQTSLAKHLADQGFKTDQSTLSRNLKKLGIEKKDGFYYLLKKKENGLKILPIPPNFIIVKTLPGHANLLALKLDAQPFPGLAGTIAGDDTILCIVENSKYLKAVSHQIAALE